MSPLELPTDCSFSDVKRGYMKVVRLIHPDKLANAPLRDRILAQTLFTVITTAYNDYRTPPQS